MARKRIFQIKSVLGGASALAYTGQKGQFLASIAIDPESNNDTSASNIQDLSSGIITPVRYASFASTNLVAAPMWMLTTPINSNVYIYDAGGKLTSYPSTLTTTSSATIGTATSGAGNGAYYYNNYLWLFTATNVTRYGPLSDSPALINSSWTGSSYTGTSGGLGLTALTNTTYPSIYNFTYPNHAAHLHYGKLYVCDFKNGIGYIHFIKTITATVLGDTNDGSKYNALALPEGYYPFDIESYGSDLIIVCSQVGTSSTIKPGKGMLFFWDTFSSKPYRGIELPDTYGTALLTHNGIPYVWSGAIGRGVRLSRYFGGNELNQVEYFEDGTPPSAGAVDSLGNRLAWGGITNYPSTIAGVYSKGFVSPKLPGDSLNQIGRISGTGTIPVVTVIKYVQENNNVPIFGWRTDTPAEYGLEGSNGEQSSVTFGSIFRSEVVNIGQPFQISKIRFPFSKQMVSGVSIVPKVMVDDEVSTTTLDTINPTNDSGKYNAVRNVSINGEHNFFIELAFEGTIHLSINLPITVELEVIED